MDWGPLGTDFYSPDCGVEACGQAIKLWTGQAPSHEAIDLAQNRFSALGGLQKALGGWLWRSIEGHRLGGYARIVSLREQQAAIRRWGCFIVAMRGLPETKANHIILVLKSDAESITYVSWGSERTALKRECVFGTAYAIVPKFHPILIWWTIKNAFVGA